MWMHPIRLLEPGLVQASRLLEPRMEQAPGASAGPQAAGARAGAGLQAAGARESALRPRNKKGNRLWDGLVIQYHDTAP